MNHQVFFILLKLCRNTIKVVFVQRKYWSTLLNNLNLFMHQNFTNFGRWLFSAAMIGCFVSCTKDPGDPGQLGNSKSFTIFNAMQYQNMPDLSSNGLHSINLINETSLFTAPTDLIPDSLKVENLAIQAANSPGIPVVMDIEDWSYSNSQLPTTIDWFLDVIRVFKQNDPGPLGFYGVVPNDAYNWSFIEPVGGSNYVKWQTLNSQLSPIADQVDLFFPSFYTDDNDTVSWNSFLNATISELKKYNTNKPVYAFVWPQYHDGYPNQYQFVDTSVWKYELEALYPLVDGIVIWSSSKILPGVSSTWDADWPWWLTTQAFIKEHNIQ